MSKEGDFTYHTAFIKHILPVLTRPRGSRNGMVNDPVGLIWSPLSAGGRVFIEFHSYFDRRAVLEVTQEWPESKRRVMGLIN